MTVQAAQDIGEGFPSACTSEGRASPSVSGSHAPMLPDGEAVRKVTMVPGTAGCNIAW